MLSGQTARHIRPWMLLAQMHEMSPWITQIEHRVLEAEVRIERRTGPKEGTTSDRGGMEGHNRLAVRVESRASQDGRHDTPLFAVHR